MIFNDEIVPGADWVEIVQITNLDGSPIPETNWRRNLFGMVTLCWIAGGFHRRGAFFLGHVRLVDGAALVVNRYSAQWCSTTTDQPEEVEPNVYDFRTNTSIYRFRMLTEEEREIVTAAIQKQVLTEMELRAGGATWLLAPEGPVS